MDRIERPMRHIPSWRFLSIVIVALVLVAGTAQAQETGARYTLKVDGLACPFCAYGIEKRLNAVEGVAEVKIDIASGSVTVVMHPGKTLGEATAAGAVAAAGFTMRSFSPGSPGRSGT